MLKTALKLLKEKTDAAAKPVRLIGIGMSGLIDKNDKRQHALFSMEGKEQIENLENTTDEIRKRLGDNAILRGVHLKFSNKRKDNDNKGK
jgi:hypothetical protein